MVRGGAILALLSLLIHTPQAAAAEDPADLRVAKADEPDPVTAGAALTYTLRVTNDGPDPAASVVLTDTLPPGVVFDRSDPSQGTCSAPVGAQVTCQLGNLGAGQVAVVRLVVVPTQAATITNGATVSSSTSDPDPSDNGTTETTKVNGPSCTRVGTRGADTLLGTAGNDVLCGAGGNDVLEPGPGADVVMGGPDRDTATYARSDTGVAADLGAGEATGEGTDVLRSVVDLVGSPNPDVLWGSAAANRVAGGGGTDLVRSRAGRDDLEGGTGGDYLDGGAGRDAGDGGPGSDVCISTTLRSCMTQHPRDGNDTRGILDVGRVRTRLRSGRPVWVIVTRGAWSPNRIWDDGFLLVFLDTTGSADPEYYALARSVGSGLRGQLFREREGEDQPVAPLRIRRPNRRSVAIRVPLGQAQIPPARQFYRWYVQTILINGPCATGCFDFVPGAGALPQPVP